MNPSSAEAALFACNVSVVIGTLSPTFDFSIKFNQRFRENNRCH
jgi:hypothetical protein